MHKIEKWLAEKPYRFTVLNVCMLTALLIMVGNVSLLVYLGGALLGICGLYCVTNAATLTWYNWNKATLFQLALIWAPGAIALVLAVGSLYLTRTYQAGSLEYIAGCALFGFEVALLTLLGAELNGSSNSLTRYFEVK